jgi:hypothetical protein
MQRLQRPSLRANRVPPVATVAHLLHGSTVQRWLERLDPTTDRSPTFQQRSRHMGTGRAWRTLLRGLAIMGISTTVVFGVTGPADASAFTISRWGYTGSLASDGDHYCRGPINVYPAVREVTSGPSSVYPTPAYARSAQTIWRQTELLYWDGSNVSRVWGNWQRGTFYSGNYFASFSAETFNVSRGGLYWEVLHHYAWSVGNTTVGRVTNAFDGYSYQVYGGAQRVNAGAGRHGNCYIP